MNKKVIQTGIIILISLISLNISFIKATTNEEFQITIDPHTLEINILMTGSTSTGETSTGIIYTETTGNISTGTKIYTGTEFQQALAWMYEHGLTKYNNENDYRPEDGLLREEAAKIIGQAFVVLGYDQITKNTACEFSDSNEIDPSLIPYIKNACKRGIFRGTTDGKFLPREQLTRPQAMALLVRMFEGKISNEKRIPWRGDYYIKAQAMGLTTLTNQNAFDSIITRREIAIYIWRLRNILLNETVKLMMLGKLAQLTTTGTITTSSPIIQTLSSLTNSLSISNDPELIEAIKRMYDNGLTNYTTVATHQPFEILNREQAAKILVKFAEVFNFGSGNTNVSCMFEDITDADASLVNFIKQACKLGIIQGSNNRFFPKTTITKAQFIAAMIRLFEGKKLDETKNPRRTTYFEIAERIGLINPVDAISFDHPITRYEVALALYRFKIKYQITQNLNSSTIENQIINTVPGSITGTSNFPQAHVYVDINLLNNGNFNIGYIEIVGNRYKIVKSGTKEYFTNNFARYGDIFTLDTNEKIGTISFIVSNLLLIEGTIRIHNSTYIITPVNNTNAYYHLKKTK